MVSVFSAIKTLVEAAANEVILSAQKAVEERGRFLLALSGGHSPLELFRCLGRTGYVERMPWCDIFILWSDERYVPLDDSRSNAGHARRLLLDHVPVPKNQVLSMYRDNYSVEEAAHSYEASLRDLCAGGEPRLDLVLLGCGEDAHTASLFPGSSAIKARSDLVVAVDDPDQDLHRLTMTPHLINLSHLVVFIVYGDLKARAVKQVLTGPPNPERYPAQAIKPISGEVYWFLDAAAAALLET